MICEQFEELAPRIAHNELRDAKLLQDAVNHAASCAACDAILIEARELAASVAFLAAHDKSVEAPVHMESALRAAFVNEFERTGRGPAPTRASFVGVTFRWTAYSLAVAAIIFAVILVPRVLNRGSEINRAAVTSTQSAAPAVASIKTAPVESIAAPATPKHLTAARKPKNNLSEPESTLTGFLALPFADDISTIEYGAIVRLQMSRADLAWYGLPVPISDTGDKVVADLFVNGSGTPEAIRLVR
jgi:hypothetical protein